MALQAEIDQTRKLIRTDGYPMSIGEWVSLYESQEQELDIHPEFQRFFRWTDHQKSALIESILLGIPIPPIFVSQRDDGVWDVVDGVQRLSTIFEFMGILKDESGNRRPPLMLQATKYLPSLAGKTWDGDSANTSFTNAQRLIVKRAKIAVSIIEKESDSMAKYELFQRLNTGGTTATPQEVRNCILVMMNGGTHKWMRELADYAPFRDTLALTERLYEEQYDMELLLRFLLLFDAGKSVFEGIGDIGVFLTEKMQDIVSAPVERRELLEKAFKSTFDLLDETCGDSAFKRYSATSDKFVGGFLISTFEVIALGLGFNYLSPPDKNVILERVKSVWSSEVFKTYSGKGFTANRRLPRLIPLGRETSVRR